jgi:hypothetical protein
MKMVNSYVWIAIVIVVFFVGIGVSYAHFANTYDPMSMKFQNQGLFDQMMSNNPKMSQHWMDSGMMNQQQMMQDPEQMAYWMTNDPKHMEQMTQIMKEDHAFMSKMMSMMMNDPELRLQMMGHMSENPDALRQMMNLYNSDNMMNATINDMDSEMHSGTMSP